MQICPFFSFSAFVLGLWKDRGGGMRKIIWQTGIYKLGIAWTREQGDKASVIQDRAEYKIHILRLSGDEKDIQGIQGIPFKKKILCKIM